MGDSEQKLKEGFYKFDLDNSGTISCREIKHVLQQHQGMDKEKAKESAKRIMLLCDKNKDGEISFEEFKNAMTKMASK